MPNLFQVEPPMNPSPSTDNVIANTELLKETVGWTCKNKFAPNYIGYDMAIYGDSQGAYITSSNGSLTYLATLEADTDYTISKKSGQGNDFTIALFTTMPTIPSTTLLPETNSEVIIYDTSINTYTFNSDDYHYVAFMPNMSSGDPHSLVNTVEAMLRKADILDSSYESYHNSVDTVKQNKTLSSPITVNGTQYNQVESALTAINNFAALIDAPLRNDTITITSDYALGGGYKTIGNMCFVQVSLSVPQSYTSDWQVAATGFPVPHTGHFLMCDTLSGYDFDAYITHNGNLEIKRKDGQSGGGIDLDIKGWYDTRY